MCYPIYACHGIISWKGKSKLAGSLLYAPSVPVFFVPGQEDGSLPASLRVLCHSCALRLGGFGINLVRSRSRSDRYPEELRIIDRAAAIPACRLSKHKQVFKFHLQGPL